jgi:hypothetical protein
MPSRRSAGRPAPAHPANRSAAAQENARASLCLFTFTDGRRCRTPRSGSHLHFCFYHARKESQAKAADKLGKDLSYFFSGDYVSACDLSTGLARLLAAVARGEIKPKTAKTLAYLAQTLLQTLHLAQHEYINALGTEAWRHAVRNSVYENFDYRNPPSPAKPASEPGAASAPASAPAPAPTHPPVQSTSQPQSPAPAKPQSATPPTISHPPSDANHPNSSS